MGAADGVSVPGAGSRPIRGYFPKSADVPGMFAYYLLSDGESDDARSGEAKRGTVFPCGPEYGQLARTSRALRRSHSVPVQQVFSGTGDNAYVCRND